MAQTADITAIVVAAINLLAAAVGLWGVWRWATPRAFWWLARTGQLATTVLAAVALVALVSGFEPGQGLFWLYLLLPIATSIIAEQLRIASAQLILDQHELEDAQAVGRLPEAEQQDIVLEIVRRETLVLALAAAVIAFLALRVLPTT
jgi:hypothetical protein